MMTTTFGRSAPKALGTPGIEPVHKVPANTATTANHGRIIGALTIVVQTTSDTKQKAGERPGVLDHTKRCSAETEIAQHLTIAAVSVQLFFMPVKRAGYFLWWVAATAWRCIVVNAATLHEHEGSRLVGEAEWASDRHSKVGVIKRPNCYRSVIKPVINNEKCVIKIFTDNSAVVSQVVNVIDFAAGKLAGEGTKMCDQNRDIDWSFGSLVRNHSWPKS